MSRYNFKEIEKKWDDKWKETKLYEPDMNNSKNPFFNLMMFPYPSAEGLHVGNMFAFTGSDIYGRFKRLQGYNVFEPIGYDAFGIHSENFAIKVNIHPTKLIPNNIKNFHKQLSCIGAMFSWDKQVNTTSPEYYKWTQWIFLQLYKNGLAYKKKALVNWCNECKSTLSDEQVVDGKCERHGTPAIKKELEQWFFKITKYAKELLDNLDTIDWSEVTKTEQRRWLGKSEGASVIFDIENTNEKIEVFTTRPDTLFGASYMVLAPEHSLITKLTTAEQKKQVEEYVNKALMTSAIEREKADREKTGVFTGTYAINPVNNAKIPVWISDYVLMDYGTGAIMAVPAHDQRDFEFAKKFDLQIIPVIQKPEEELNAETMTNAMSEDGIMINSGIYNGKNNRDVIGDIIDSLKKQNKAEKSVNYRLRDWCISRQRYWGPPIPIIYCPNCGTVPVPEDELPVILPYIENFQPKGMGKSPLALDEEFLYTKCPKCGHEKATRETDVNDNFLDSAWYFLRYPSADIHDKPFDEERTKKWLPVSMYIGGNEHAVLHLMYTRFLCMALNDLGLIHFREPFKKFRAHGLITKDGAKMSKSHGNIVVPDEFINEYGSDVFRLYLMFLGPLDQAGDFRDQGITGMSRFLDKIWRLYTEGEIMDTIPENRELNFHWHRTIKKVGDDLENLKYNTAIAAIMELVNFLTKENITYRPVLKDIAILLASLAPHITEELWEVVGEKYSVHNALFPKYNEEYLQTDTVTIVVQINGKVRDKFDIEANKSEDEVKTLALEKEKVQKHIENKNIIKTIYIPDKLINFIIK